MRGVAFAGALCALSCGKGGGGSGVGPGAWTVLIYMAADNTLEAAAKFNLESAATVGSGGGITLLAQVDRSPKSKGAGYTGDPFVDLQPWSGTKRVRIDVGHLEVLQNLDGADKPKKPTLDEANKNTLADFVTWGIHAAPAQRYALILWDHGGGWRSYGVDETHNSRFDLATLSAALQAGLGAANVGKFDLLGFDACLMATLETAEQLHGFADALVFSEEKEPAHGWDYAAIAQTLHDQPQIAPLTLGHVIADSYVALAKTVNAAEAKSVTLSVIEGTKVDAAVAALDAFAQKLTTLLSDQASWQKIAQARAQAHEFGSDRNQSRKVNTVDIVDLSDNIKTLLADAADPENANFEAAAKTAICYSVAGEDQAKANGLALFFPPQKAQYTTASSQGWPQLLLNTRTHWDAFVSGFVGASAISATPPAIANLTVTPAVTRFKASAQVTASNGVRSITLDVVQNTTSDGQIVLGTFPIELASSFSNGTVTGTWDYRIFELSDGSTDPTSGQQVNTPVPVLYDQTVNVRGTNYTQFIVPATYKNPGDTDAAAVSLFFLSDGANQTFEGIFEQGAGGSWSQVPAKIDSDLGISWLQVQSGAFVPYAPTDTPTLHVCVNDKSNTCATERPPQLLLDVVYAGVPGASPPSGQYMAGFNLVDLAGVEVSAFSPPLGVLCNPTTAYAPCPQGTTCDAGSNTCM